MTNSTTLQLQGVYVRSHQRRTDSKDSNEYIAYAVEVHAASGGRTWTVWRRYSEFEQLASDIEAELTTASSSWKLPPLPPKRENLSTIMLKPWKGVSGNKDDEFIANRQAGLERFLRAILASKDERAQAVRQARAWTAFLGADSSSLSLSGGTGSKASENAYTASSWLEEYNALDGQVKEIQSLLHRRDALIDKGDTTSAHKASVDAKKLLAKQTASMTVLASALDNLAKGGLSEGELRRRLDMVAKMQDKTLLLGQLAANASTAARLSSTSRSTPSTANPENRTALLGSSKPVTRVLGKAAVVQETEQTRTLDNMGLLQLQLQQVDDQDQKLNSLTAVIRRQRELATAIGVELNEQNEMLDSVGLALSLVICRC